MQARVFHLHALSALHCGTGQSVEVVDLPIARARASHLPIVPGSSLRGTLRQHVTDCDMENSVETLFGPREIRSNEEAFAGALSIGDGQLLTLPVRCLAGVVSYVTSPFILRRYFRDLKRTGIPLPVLPSAPDKGTASVTPGSVNRIRNGKNDQVVLEDLDLRASENKVLKKWAHVVAGTVHPDDMDARDDFVNRFTLVPDSVMSFLSETATEIRARIRIDPGTGTVSKGALWYEEYLPAETLLWGVFALSNFAKSKDSQSEDGLLATLPMDNQLLQLGGNAGVGHGLIRFFTRKVQA